MLAESLSDDHVRRPAHAGSLSRLPILILNVHENCNCKCQMCDIWKRPAGRELSVDAAESYVRSMRELRVERIVLTGGEPLLHSKLPDLCKVLKESGAKITLLSTGLLLSKRAYVLAEYVDDVIVSLDGPSGIHNAIRRVPGAFELLRTGVRSLRDTKHHFPVHARSTIQRENFQHLRETVGAAKSIGCDSISFLPVDTTSAAFNRELVWPVQKQNEVGLSALETDLLEKEVEQLISANRIDIAKGFIGEGEDKLRRIVRFFRQRAESLTPTAPLCNAPWVSAVIEVDGSVRPCFFHKVIGETASASLVEALNSVEATEFRSTLEVAKNTVCQNCVCSLNYRS